MIFIGCIITCVEQKTYKKLQMCVISRFSENKRADANLLKKQKIHFYRFLSSKKQSETAISRKHRDFLRQAKQQKQSETAITVLST